MSEGLSLLGRTAAAAREEVLEELWSAHEVGLCPTVAELASTIHAGASEGWGGVVQELVEQGLVLVSADRLTLTAEGLQQARLAARRHRLAEVLFHQVLDLPLATTEQEACRIEHVLSPQATEAVCSFLGHPPVSPHGRPIPPGECCQALSRRTVAPLITRLVDLSPGERGKVVLVAPRHRERLEQLSDYGVVPGAVLVLKQRQPSLVVEVDRTPVKLAPLKSMVVTALAPSSLVVTAPAASLAPRGVRGSRAAIHSATAFRRRSWMRSGARSHVRFLLAPPVDPCGAAPPLTSQRGFATSGRAKHERGLTMAMKRFVIERDIPSIGSASREDLSGAAGTSNAALAQLAPRVQWEHSYVAGDKTFCIYLAENEDAIHEHARISGFPATTITEIRTVIDPTTEG